MMRNWLVMVSALALLTGCGGPEPGSGRDLAGTNWVVTNIGSQPTLVTHRPTMQFGTDSLSGSASCNHYQAQYHQDGAGLAITPGAMTQMACEPTAVMDQEQAFIAALAEVASFKVKGAGLEMIDAAGRTRLVLEPVVVVNRELTGTQWSLSSIITGETLTSTVAGSAVTMELGEGRLFGKACNNFNGPVSIDGDSLTVGPLASTKMACQDQAVADQESKVLAMLAAATRFKIEGDTLTLTAPNGDGLVFTAK